MGDRLPWALFTPLVFAVEKRIRAASAAAAVFALMAVSVQIAKAARTNPAERLRRE